MERSSSEETLPCGQLRGSLPLSVKYRAAREAAQCSTKQGWSLGTSLLKLTIEIPERGNFSCLIRHQRDRVKSLGFQHI